MTPNARGWLIRSDLERIRARYRRLASFYDRLELRPFRRLRARAIEMLQLDAGQAVLDLGCGTGLSLGPLARAVRAEGRVVALDLSPEMLAYTKQRVRRQGWPHVLLVEADARRSPIRAGSLDGVLAFYTHDIMTSAEAVARAVEALRPGGRFVAGGGKRAQGPAAPLLNALTAAYSWPFADIHEHPDQPWLHLERELGPLAVEKHLCGSAYLVRGIKRL